MVASQDLGKEQEHIKRGKMEKKGGLLFRQEEKNQERRGKEKCIG